MRKMKNAILKTTTWIAGITWTLSACALDSESNIPLIAYVVASAWLCLFVFANAEDKR